MTKSFTKAMLIAVCLFSQGLTCWSQSLEWRQTNSNITAYQQHPSLPNTIFAGDQAGIIRRSDDQGTSWRIVSMQSESPINSISFLDNNTGLATTTERGLMLFTNDAGNTWKRKVFMDTLNPQLPFGDFKRIIKVDEKTAFLDIFNHPISGPTPQQTIVTRDGGQTFSLVYSPGNLFHVSGDTMIAFGRTYQSFLNRFTISKSVDKGQTWQVVKLNPTGFGGSSDFGNEGINFATFINSKTFFINMSQYYGSDVRMYKTNDGGLTFTSVTGLPNTKVDWMFFKNQNEGVAIQLSGSSTSYYTTDGGTVWTASPTNVKKPGIYLGNETLLANLDGRSIISKDFGKTWIEQSVQIYNYSNVGMANQLMLKVVNDSTSYASLGRLRSGVLDGFTLVRTSNKGVSWEQVADVSNTLFSGGPYHFISRDTFYFIGSGYKEGSTTEGGYMKIKLTTDGGKTSKDIYTGNYNEDVREIVFIDKKYAATYAINSNRFNYSIDSGKTWNTTVPLTSYGQIKKVAFPSFNTWYMLSAEDKVYKSIDQGLNWTPTGAMTGGGCKNGIYFINEEKGFTYGCQGTLFKTIDGGTNWSNITSSIALEPATLVYNNNQDMSFQTPNTGFMLDPGANGSRTVTYTNDGGLTWNLYSKVQNNLGLFEVDVRDERAAAMLGNTGNFNIYTGPIAMTTDTLRLINKATGVEEEKLAEAGIRIYPNPAQNLLHVEAIGNSPVLGIKVRDLSGRTVHSQTNSTSSQILQVELFHLNKGMYLMELETSKGKLSGKIMIE